MAKIFPIDFEEKNSIACGDFILFSDSEDGDKIKKAQYSNLKGEKGDTGNAATVCVGSTTTGAAGTCACVTNGGDCHNAVLNFTIPKGDKGDTGQTGPAIISAAFNGDDIDFTEEDGNIVTLTNAKICLKGDKGDTGCTGAAGCSGASICAAAFNGNNIDFTETNGCVVTLTDAKTCLKGEDGCAGPQGPGATICVGSTTTLDAGCSATVSNSGTCTAAVLNFGIPKGDKGDTGATGCTGPAGNGIACVTSTKNGKVTTVDITCTNGCSYCFDVSDGEDGQGSGDMLKCVYDPNNVNANAFDYCNFTNTPTIPTDNCQLTNGCGYTTCTGTITQVCMNGASCGTSGVINLGTVVTDVSGKQDTLTAGANVSIVSNKICADNYFIIKESDACTTYTGTKGVSPYNTSYCYTNICINPDSGVTWKEGAVYSFDIDAGMIATSACRNVRVKIGSGEYIPVMGTSSILGGSSYFTKGNIRQYQYSTKYINTGALHLFTDSNTTYSAMTNAEATTGTCTSGRSIAACTLKCAIQYYSPTDNCQLANSCGYITSSALSGYALSCDIPTNNCQLTNGCGYTTCTGTLTAETVVSGDTGCTYTIKVGNSEPGAGTPATTITFVTA